MTQLVPVTLTPGMTIYKYWLVKEIGSGSFGDVWLAQDLAVQQQYAVKILQPGVSVDQRLREAQIGNRLKHNNLLHIHQADVVDFAGDCVVILAMDYQPKGSVEGLANPAGYLPLPTVLRIARDILQGLEYLHARSFYHNDIKPGNILLGPQGQAMLSDYGITGVSAGGAPVAAPSAYLLHLAPEVVSTGNIGVSSDIFQVGMTLARLLIHLDHLNAIWSRIGPMQFKRDIVRGALLRPADFGSHIPSAVRRAVLRAVHSDPAQRYSSALEMRRALEKLNYPGHWTVDAAGKEVGKRGAYEFSYSVSPVSHGKFDVICSKRNIGLGNIQRVTRFCRRGQKKNQAEKLISDFKKFVVVGK